MSCKTFYVVAFKSEILWLFDEYKLVKKDNEFFKIYENDNIKVIISGKSSIKSAIATTYLASIYDIKDNDTIINYGTCASKTNKIGEVFEFGQIIDISTNQKFLLDKSKEKIFCSPKEIFHTNHKYGFVDMESVGFYVASKKFFTNIKIVKVVSDNFTNYKEIK